MGSMGHYLLYLMRNEELGMRIVDEILADFFDQALECVSKETLIK
jgi:hypothetical protein